MKAMVYAHKVNNR